MRMVKKIKASPHLFESEFTDFKHQMGDTIKVVSIKATPVLYWYEIVYDEVFDEQWKDVPGFEVYKVSNLGRVKRKIVIKPYLDERTGYLQCNFSIKQKQKPMRVHRAVALAWVPNPENLPDVGHRDFVKTNNVPENLYWK